MKLGYTIALLCYSLTAVAEQPRPNDYYAGVTVAPAADRPVVELVLPDAVYLSVTRIDLGDLRVFNGDGNAVPHAVCSSDTAHAATTTREQLSIFPLRAAAKSTAGSRVDVQTVTGTQVQ